VIEAENGRSGLFAARRSRPSLIFLDLMLPDFRGEDLLEVLKGDAELQQVPVAVMTSGVLTREQRERLSLRAQVVVQKSELTFDSARAILAVGGI
jgi:DNA-binding response OmpR family regulator